MKLILMTILYHLDRLLDRIVTSEEITKEEFVKIGRIKTLVEELLEGQ